MRLLISNPSWISITSLYNFNADFIKFFFTKKQPTLNNKLLFNKIFSG